MNAIHRPSVVRVVNRSMGNLLSPYYAGFGAFSDGSGRRKFGASFYKHSIRKFSAKVNKASAAGEKVTMVSFNLLAPPYKRLAERNTIGRRLRESQDPVLWNERAKKALEFFEQEIFGSASIIALQEFWLETGYFQLFEPFFQKHGYEMTYLKRAGAKTDSVVVCVKSSEFEILDSKDVQLIPNADRVALLLHLKQRSSGNRMILANTHLSFPHTGHDGFKQLKQVQALTKSMSEFNESVNTSGGKEGEDVLVHRFIIGDFNQPLDSPVCDHLRSEGYISTFEISPPTVNPDATNSADVRDNSDEKPSRHDKDTRTTISAADVGGTEEVEDEEEMDIDTSWVSHRTHEEQEVGVDHIFFFNHKHEENDGASAPSSKADGGTGTSEESRESTPKQGWQGASLFIGDCRVLPEDMTCAYWDGSFDISDHRPISSEVFLSGPPPASQ